MAATFPKSDASRFASIDLAALVCAFLLKSGSATTVKTLRSKLGACAKADSLNGIAEQLVTKGEVSLQGDKLQLTESGKAVARRILGSESSKPWQYIRDRRLPTLALGLDPDSSEVRRKLAR